MRRETLDAEPIIEPVRTEDVEEILALQQICFQSEAELYDDFSIPALKQTLAELLQEFATSRVLKIVLDGKIAGSVRAKIVGETCHIGRLIVHPAHQGHGLGTRLMSWIESEFESARQYEVFTGSRSVANLKLYERRRYCEVRRVTVSSRLELVYLQKPSISTK